MNDIRSSVYAQKVELLLRLIPIVMEEEVFAIHGGTAINLFLKDLPRYSVDIDLTYIPLADRQTSLDDINMHLNVIAEKAKKAFKGMHIVPNFTTCKLLCEYRGKQVKIEVNQTKRGVIGGDVQTIPLALSRQHPRDLFDVKYMDISLSDCREGLIFCLLGSDRPIYESFAPSLIDQREAMDNQFAGMTDIPFTYEEFEETRSKLINDVKSLMTEADKRFLISFESGQPEWDGYEFEYFKDYPSVQWKLLNLKKLAKQNPQKLQEEEDKLRNLFNFNLNN